MCNLERAITLGLCSLDCALPGDILSELLPLSPQFSSKSVILLEVGPTASFFFFPSLPTPGLDKLLSAEPLSLPLNPKKHSCGHGPDRVFILFNPSDDASMGDTEAADSATSVLVFDLDLEPSVEFDFDEVRVGVRISLPLEISFFLLPSLTCAWRQAVKPVLVVVVVVVVAVE